MGRLLGSKNKPKLDEHLSKLATIAMDPAQDAETRRAAADALQGALAPPPESKPAPPSPRKGFVDPQSNRFICGCDPFSAEGECTYCIAEAPVVTPAVKLAPQVPQLETDVLDLDALARELA